ncbi:DEAD/DEAH box helicase [Dactylosporangium sp. NBC_01737]|uniref:DEAD/DEAH box helicase n=1 Tax=Dactylosporangium sp. NBC_01737 TaxID=2975959 RepID=UPI002E13728C|nr:DEAD/DEAH box helicase [Dactylosporangium sp. NBC_01737]
MTGVDHLHPGLVHHIVNTLGWPDLRPLQSAAIEPILGGHDALLLAPTAGGKTEAAVFPTLSAMADRDWSGISVLYLCPLRALLNNLHPRIAGYASWIGRTAGLWHGDTGATQRRRLRIARPDLLLTTPESLEAMLVSTLTDPRQLFADLRLVIVDEVHAFASDDRGWHLLAVLERLSRLAGRRLQRIGLSATVGNPDQLLHWLQGANVGHRTGTVVAPDTPTGPAPRVDVTLDYVGSVDNAATIIAALHHGEKRLAFCDSRSQVEQLAFALRGRGVQTFVSHSSLAADERRQAEEAFAEARDCVIVATSTLELGVDVGDLDRVIQLDAPRTVASFLQRLGRTGRRPGTARNTLFLTTKQDTLLKAAGLLTLWRDGYVEPVTPPPTPRHIVAQQLLALCLQEGRVGADIWPAWYGDLSLFDDTTPRIVDWLVATGHLDLDTGMLAIGPETERRYGRRHFMELLTVFAAPPEFTVLHGRQQIGSTDALALTIKVDGPRVIVLGGRTWKVTHVDWNRQRCYVEGTDLPGRSLWHGFLPPQSYELAQAQRRVLLGTQPDVNHSHRAEQTLATLREDRASQVWDGGTVVQILDDEHRWWTWAGRRANATLAASLPKAAVDGGRLDDHMIRLRGDLTAPALRQLIDTVDTHRLPAPEIDDEAVTGLKFGEVLPADLATTTLAERAADGPAAQTVLASPFRWVTSL